MRLLSNPNQINSNPNHPSQNRFSPLQKSQFLTFLFHRETEELPENLYNYANRHHVSRQTRRRSKMPFFGQKFD